jgi:N4-gp56 family major capsid protein
MALTNFAALTNEEKTAWSMDMWKHARNNSFMNQFTGSGSNAMIQRITELTKTQKGARAVITLLADLEGDGIVGDRTLEGNEEALKSYEQVIRIDQMRHANRHEGRLADQKSIINFREMSRDTLAYWLADRLDQLAFLTLSGVSYAMNTNGTARVGSDFPFLEFAADVAPLTDARRLRWDVDTLNTLVTAGATTDLVAADKISWETLVRMKEYAKTNFIRGIKPQGGLDELFHVFMTPRSMANLKLDDAYNLNLRHSNSKENAKLFNGGVATVDGLVLHEYRHAYHSDLWGSGAVKGTQVLMCGAQAMGFADIGTPEWVEKKFDYDNQPGISVQKMVGFLKPRFNSIYAGNTVQDHGLLSCYVAD